MQPATISPQIDAQVERPTMPKIGVGRSVAVLAVHHIHADGCIYTGGAEKYLRVTIRALLESGARVHVGYSGHSIYDELLAEFQPSRLTVERTGWLDEALSGDARLTLAILRDRRRWLRASGADTVFVVQQGGGTAFAASLIAARSLGLRVVMSVRQQPHAVDRLAASLGLRRFIPGLWRMRQWLRRCVPAYCCRAIIFNSPAVAEQYGREMGWPRKRCRVIPNGEMPAPPRPARTRPVRVIGAVGRLSDAKGARTLLDAFTPLAREFPDARLVYFGDGPLRESLAALAGERGLGQRIRLEGYCRDRNRIYSEIDVLAQLSTRESMSNSVIEAMAHSLPCVVSDVGGLPETVLDGVTGFVVAPSDAPSAASALRRIMEDAMLADRMGRAGRQRVETEFRLDRVMEETVRAVLGLARTTPTPITL